MSNLIKPYIISVWEDKLINGQLTEIRLGVIGANDMLTQSRVLEPNLIRNSNGTKRLTFKMYKKYIDTITGEKVDNPFSDWLVAERKVKLEYEDKWYDFVVKDVVETSANYLYQYSLEDALVQELSKNGFGVTFDAELMNNMGDIQELATAALQETDWSVESEVFVQTVDEALVYVEVPANTKAKHILDQSDDNLSVGVTIEDEDYEFSEPSTVLAFYSCCKNKPHRFQFIYSENGYDSGPNGYEIARKDDRTINQKNCQYFIDFEKPDEDYDAPDENLNDAEALNLWLPKGFKIGVPGVNRDAYGNLTYNDDSTLSSWYRGKRYGFAQQSVYVPLLERYCQKFKKQEAILLTDKELLMHQDGGGSITMTNIDKNEETIIGFVGTKNASWSGYKIKINYSAVRTYLLSYKLKVNAGTLYTIGGHNASFHTEMEVKHGDKIYKTSSSYINFGDNGLAAGQTIEVFAKYNKFTPETTDSNPYIFIQPNRGSAEEVSFTISDFSLKYDESYLGYTESEFVSPTLIQNCINNYNFESTAGWTATSSAKTSSVDRPKVENAYGRFENSTFSTITEDFLDGSYTESKTYTPYMKMEFYNNQQFVLNSGIRDNRTMIQNMSAGEEWVLDYKIVDANGNVANDEFDFSLGEYIYNTNSGGYNPRDGFITFSNEDADSEQTETGRKIFTVENTSYDKETFKKSSKIYLKIIPNSDPNSDSEVPSSTQKDSSGDPIGYKFYIEKIALYRKTIGADGKIIIPDLEEQNTTAETFIETGTIEHKYHYFSDWLINNDNPNSIKEKEKLVTEVKNTLNYETYVPVYNEGAKKIRSITVKESNYFNILQTIAETFEAWLDLEIERETDGAIKSKKVKFKNYLGNENYANFRYGVNLKDIQRTTSSKNIVTKLVVKQNSNELAENGFCTIQRAGANPTGENYIYDFQYYQNMGIMDTDDFLKTAYYIDGAQGKDGELWDGSVTTDDEFNLNGYYPRIKKINDAILPINEELIGLNADLLEKKAKLEVEEATYEASITGIEQVREDFVALTGIYPEEAQSGAIDSVSLPNENAVVPKEDWWEVDTSVDDNGYNNGISLSNNVVSVAIKTTSQRDEEHGFEVKANQGVTMHNSYAKSYKFTKSSEWAGLYIENKWEENRDYVLTYEIEATEGELLNIGCHNSHFSTNFSIEVKNRQGSVVASSNLAIGTKYFVTVKGKRKIPTSEEGKKQDSNLWIQPNRGETNSVTCIVSNIKLYKVLIGTETASAKDREAHFCLNVDVGVGEATIARTYEMTAIIPSNHTTGISIEQQITAIDLSRNDVQKYLTEYTTYYEKRESSNTQKEALKTSITNKEASIKAKENRRKDLLEYKKQLNYLFFKKYSHFIQEGTWISEEYVDDDKYFADSQSVLYNSCYPQVGYAINVVALSSLPGYEHFVYGLGDKTNIIDEEFFGPNYQEEVIITEIIENLDDPSKNIIKVQNFKNQFQDLFQKITATVQQTQYNVGSYEKGAALVEANLAKQNEFITNAINGAQTYLNHGQTVKTGPDGITITDDSDKQNQLRLVGGAILFSTTDKNTQEQTWMTGVTKDGISANLITAGRLDAGVVQIMSGNDPVFRWDAYGISAYDALWTKTNDISTISGINTKKFVRFDKNGIYGINNAAGVDGASWHPDNIGQIDEKATFALTWEGLKVTGNDNVVARIGKMDDAIIKVNDGSTDTFIVEPDGDVTVKGTLILSSGDTVEDAIDTSTNDAIINFIETEFEPFKSSIEIQIDGKAETWYQAEDPSINWDTPDLKSSHEGDLWKYTGEDTTERTRNSEWVWKQAVVLYKEIPYIFDVFVHHGGKWDDRDTWSKNNIYTAYKDSKFYYYYYDDNTKEWTNALPSNETEGSWPDAAEILLNANKITKQNICYVESTKRLWAYENDKAQSFWTAEEAKENPPSLDYTWIEMDVSDEVFDKIDGKSNIFVALPSSGVQVNEGDILIPSTNITANGKVQYSAGKVYRYTQKDGASSFSWEPIDYTDDSALDAFKIVWGEDKAALEKELGAKLDSNKLSITTQIDSNGRQVVTTVLNNVETKTYTSPNGNYVLTGVGLSGTEDGKQRMFEVSANGLLQANNAIIYGDLYANGGYIAGWDITRSNTEKSIKTGDLGFKNGFHMYSTPKTASDLFGSSGSKYWMLGIGSGFGVTSDGGVYATHGRIGNLTITQLNSSKGNNLITYLNTNSTQKNFDGFSSPTSQNFIATDTVMKWDLTKTTNASGSKISSSTFVVDNVYTLSFKFKRKGGGGLINIGGHGNGFEQISFKVDGASANNTYVNGHTFSSTNDQEHTVVFTGRYKGNDSDNNLYIQVNRGESENTKIRYELWDVMLVEGDSAGAWGYSYADQAYLAEQAKSTANAATDEAQKAQGAAEKAQEAARQAAQQAETAAANAVPLRTTDNAFSWVFDKGTGFYMYNGVQNDSNIVLGVYQPENKTNYEAYVKGNIVAESGKIAGWTINDNSITKGTLGYNGFHMFSVDGGNYGTYFGASKGSYWALGIGKNFGVTMGGALYANAANIKGTITAVTKDHAVRLSAKYGLHLYQGTNETFAPLELFIKPEGLEWGVRTATDYTTPGCIGVTIDSDGVVGGLDLSGYHTTNYLRGSWYLPALSTLSSSSGVSITSDRNYKNSIVSMYDLDAYDIIFDNLQPCAFKYNDGTSGRTHTGFIAQEVQNAIDIADVNIDDFAAICIYDKGTDKERWALRYDEFVSLNTWQIQKLKSRVTTAEEKISQLEFQLSKLTAEFKNLQKS